MKIKRKEIIKLLEKLAEESYDVYEKHNDSVHISQRDCAQLALAKWDAYLDVLIALRDGCTKALLSELKDIRNISKKPFVKSNELWVGE